MPDVIVRLRPALQLRPAGGVVADGARATAHAQLVIGGMAGAENRSTQLRFEIAHVDGNDVPQGIALIVGREPSFGVAQEVRALAHNEVPPRRARGALLGDDLHHSTRGLGAVQGRRRRSLKDLDALDVVGVEVVVARDGRRAERLVRRSRRWIRIDPHAVHVHQRLV